jgi:5,10-methylene-tetrahydrofolate dehydrogenase/methenyl tetrahydrofolate cyclohydrolase
MPAEKIDGKAMAESIRVELQTELAAIRSSGVTETIPGLAVIIVGTRKDSQTYVRLKSQSAEECGFKSIKIELPEDISQADLEAKIREVNEDPLIHGLIVQLPLPKHIHEAQVLETISPAKDVDGLHPINVGLLTMKGRDPYFKPCTPSGVIEMLERSNVQIAGKRAVVVGRSNIVGIPAAHLLLQKNATVTICHSKTENIEQVVREADIIVAACGQRELVRGSWVKPGAVVIDVGTNAVDDPSKKLGYRLVGDCHFQEVSEVASKISPVPGGVGPMTIAMLLKNAFISWKRSLPVASPQPAPAATEAK